MSKELWLNLPVKDLNKSKEFFTRIGFSLNPQHPNNDEAVSLVVGDNKVIVMLFPESTFKGFTRHEVADTQQAAEVLLSIGAESREEVDELVRKAAEAGGTIYGKPGGEEWMYGAGFADLDGHRWNVLYMDMSKRP
ncbi:VOC family protein [Paenibacillus mendelii]|uniref:VOC family protein n=1 Tax=Paenibacillus mendelii TaxID=206163 RepID=A0ABV6JPU8_9BACL|nr:VOC family protein [Paenibacillus mendelii]MCQ6560596.1 VOC family protein [Paenibacillus mendelii]